MARIEHDVQLQGLNSFGLAARAAHLARCASDADVGAALAEAGRRGWRHLVLGGGSNVVFTGDFDGLVLRIESRGITLLEDGGPAWRVRAAAGENWHDFVMHALAQGWHGLENLALIPGTVGAAPVQNIGAYGVELADRLEAVRVLDTADGTIRTMTCGDCGFGYRDSVFRRQPGRFVILDVTFRLPRAHVPVVAYADLRAALTAQGIDAPTAREVAATVIAIRRAKLPDPGRLGNVGSFFKNPVVPAAQFARLRTAHPGIVGHPQDGGLVKLAAAWLIDRAGWKGRHQGGAAVHDRHALVLVNTGGARAADVLGLARAIQADVRQRFGVELEPEPVLV
ncbi:MAG: UDP-N-acetylmuramate dehydrogenase [Burkholderiales bacterium]|nr:UDP-N-acetylmuramate dehydrogenase [Burkholderiales bacterium]